MEFTIALAAGKGTRMKSALNKMMHPALSKPMTGHVVDTSKASGVERTVAVVGHGVESVEEYPQGSVEYAIRQPQLGTGHAVVQASVLESLDGDTIVVNGDGSCIQKETTQRVFESNRNAVCTVLTSMPPDGKHYGRIIRDAQGMIEKIVEAKDCSEKELEIKETSTGIFCFNNKALFEGLKEITSNNVQQGHYLTDLVEIFSRKDLCVSTMIVDDPREAMDVNDRADLAKANVWMKRHVDEVHVHAGVTIIDPDNTYIGVDAVIGEDTVIYPNVRTQGKIVIDKNTVILPNSFLHDTITGDDVTVDSSKTAESSVGNRSTVGPMSYLRNNIEICEDCRIGNFMELKSFHLDDSPKCAHLTYTGDSDFGKKINVDYNAVIVNYDGKHKFRTTVHNGAFTGSNCNPVTPVATGGNALLAAGSTITDSVDNGDMRAVRARQSIKKGFGTVYKSRQERNRIVEQWRTKQ